MPDRETIFRKTDRLPVTANAIERGFELQGVELWEGNELGATFKVSKELVGPMPVYALSVRGERPGVRKIIRDFVNTFGQPMAQGEPIPVPGLRVFLWDAKAIDEQR